MSDEQAYLTIEPLPAQFDRIYSVRGRKSDTAYDVNPARLVCSCPDWTSQRSSLPPGDVRRVCEHLYDRLYATKAERSFSPLQRLFIRYGRSMCTCRVVVNERGVLVVGQPFSPGVVRGIGVIDGKSIVATYDAHDREWSSLTDDLSDELSGWILDQMRATLPEAFTLADQRQRASRG